MPNPRVFVPQVPSRYDRSINRWVPTVNLDSAKMFGEVQVLLPPEAGRMSPEDLRVLLGNAMSTITAEDWLLTTGDPIIMGIAMTLAARKLNGLLRILRWDRHARAYDPVEVQI